MASTLKTDIITPTTAATTTINTLTSSSATITGGTITGITDIAVADGGTGASTAANARTNLGLVIGTDVQGIDAELSALAGLTSAANKVPYFTGSGTATTTDLTASGRSVIGSTVAAKGDLIAGTASATVGIKSVGTDGQAIHADSTQTSGLVYLDNPSRSNLLINPNWQIDQINEGTLYTVNAADVRGPDGWSGTSVGAGVFKLRTLADPENVALKCLEITCTTADASIAATDDYFIYTAIEGYDATSLMIGTSTAQAITAQFKFKTSVTGVYGVSIANSALNRRYVGIITVADTSEHEYSVSLTLDTAGTWLYTNGVGCYLRLCLSAGSNFQATAGAWAAGSEQTTSAQANFMSNTANIAYLKRIQLIPGALVQAYKPADLRLELAKAQRYQRKSWSQGTAVGTATAAGRRVSVLHASTAATSTTTEAFPPMRAVPTNTFYRPDTGASGFVTTGNGGAVLTVSTNDNPSDSHLGGITTTVGAGAGEMLVHYQFYSSARLS